MILEGVRDTTGRLLDLLNGFHFRKRALSVTRKILGDNRVGDEALPTLYVYFCSTLDLQLTLFTGEFSLVYVDFSTTNLKGAGFRPGFHPITRIAMTLQAITFKI